MVTLSPHGKRNVWMFLVNKINAKKPHHFLNEKGKTCRQHNDGNTKLLNPNSV